jgi:hypothetical protein
MSGGGGGNQSVTQEFKPPEYTKEGWKGYLDSAITLKDRPYEQSGLPQVAPMNDYQDAANKLAYDLGTYGTPQGNAANGAFYNAASGAYANPWAQNLTARAQAGAAGLAKQVGQNANQMLQQQQQYKGQMYNQDIGNMLNANQMGIGAWQNDIGNILAGAQGGLAGNQDYRQNLQGLMQAGNNQNSYYQKLLDQYNNQWATQEGYDALQNDIFGTALSRASGSYGGQATTGPGQSPWANVAGLLTGGAGLYSLFNKP